MERWHTQFDRLKNQWSNYNWLDSQYKPFSKELVAKIGVAWVVKIPDEDFQEPVGWEAEIIDTPLGISERSHQLIKWLRNPPHFYDRLSTYNDSLHSMVEEPYWIAKDIRPYRTYATNLSNHWPKETFTIPSNEYEIFKKTCCQCREKSYKNTSTSFDSDVASTRLNIDKNESSLIKKFPMDDHQINHIQKSENPVTKYDKTMNTVSNQNIQSDIEKEVEAQIIRDFSYPLSKANPNGTSESSSADKSIGTSGIFGRSKMNHSTRRSSKGNQRSSYVNGCALSKQSVDDKYKNNDHKLSDENKTTGAQKQLQTSIRSRIPSIDVFTDDILTRGTSLEDYRDFENNNNIPKTFEKTEYNRPNLNSACNKSKNANQNREQNLSKVNFNKSNNETKATKMADAAVNVTVDDLTRQS